MGVTPVWTLESAKGFLAGIEVLLTEVGVVAQVIGSVATQGFSLNDLDVLLAPIQPMTLEAILGAIEAKLLPELSSDESVNPLESASHENEWFVNIMLKDGRVVEFYLPEFAFPLES